jgi:outer membrane protein assembly factor BamE (lipoprotein component of BamABCDE complex)
VFIHCARRAAVPAPEFETEAFMSTFIRLAGALSAAALAAGCASFDGGNLAPGKSTRAEVEATMGRPAEVVPNPNGDTVLYFSRQPYGRANYAVTVGPDGVLRSVRQLLTRENIAKVTPGMNAKQVRELLGPPYKVDHMQRMQRDTWEYWWRIIEERRIMWVQFSFDGEVREVVDLYDFASYPQGASIKP